MPDGRTRRNLLRTVGATAALGLAGCSDSASSGTIADSPSTDPRTGDGSPTEPSTGEDDRPTATERSPRPLDVGGNWAQFGSGPGHDGATDATGVPENGKTYWHLRRIRSGPPVLADGRLLHYAKLGANTDGRPTLTRTVAEPSTAHPTYGEPAIVARDASRGRIQWSASLPHIGSGWPAVGDGTVVTAVPGQIAAFDAKRGKRQWSVDLGEKDPGELTVVGDSVLVPIQGVVDTGGDYVQRPAIRAYGLARGKQRWSVEPPKRANHVAVADGTVVVVSGGWDGTGVVLGLARADGSEQWRTETPGDAFRIPVVSEGAVYVASSDDYVRALNLADGAERWRQTVANGTDGVAVGGDTVYVGAGSSVFALAASDGGQRWRATPTDHGDAVTPAIGKNAVYAGMVGNEAPLVALDPADGSERWRHQFPNQTVDGDMVMGGVEAQPVVADGGVYVNAVDGLYAFGPAE